MKKWAKKEGGWGFTFFIRFPALLKPTPLPSQYASTEGYSLQNDIRGAKRVAPDEGAYRR